MFILVSVNRNLYNILLRQLGPHAFFYGQKKGLYRCYFRFSLVGRLRGAVWIARNAKGTCNGLLMAQTTKLALLHSKANNLFYIRGISYSRIWRAKFDYKPPPSFRTFRFLASSFPFHRFMGLDKNRILYRNYVVIEKNTTIINNRISLTR